ncbi:diacylglycerol kinase (ATP) [Flavobacteriaceae bacterium UJ101]|nr:diacylglycerol kinase (ATP) [Flavobacteriaceae bacterium UJ101]
MNEKLVFIINPISGIRSKDMLESNIQSICERNQKDYEIFYTQYAKHLPLLVEELVKKGYKKIIVAGGDGTINEAGSVLIHQDVALGIIPQGSGNGLARHLKISLDPKKAIEQIVESNKTITIDVGKVNEYYFFSNAGLGFDADVIKHYETIPDRGLKTYFRASFKSLAHFKRFEISLNNEKKKFKTFLVNVANGSQYGYGYTVAPVASLQDGVLDLVAGTMKSKFGLLCFGAELLFKIKKTTKLGLRKAIKDITIHASEKVPLQTDGELKGNVDQAHFEVVPNSLKIII